MSNIFRDFYKIKSMNKGIIIGIPVVIAIIIGIVGFAMLPEDDKMEVEDALDRETLPENIPMIEEKLEEIEKIADNSTYEPLPREWQSSGPFQIDIND